SHSVEGKGNLARYVPCRVVQCNDETAIVQLLDGRYEDDEDLPAVINAALIRAYVDKVKSGRGPHSQWAALGPVPDGTPVAAYLNRTLKRKGDRYRWREAENPLAIVD